MFLYFCIPESINFINNLLIQGSRCFIMEVARPLDALNRVRNQRVLLDLKNGKQMVGKLQAFDIHINVVLEDAEERVDGDMKRKLGTIFIRGDTIIMISGA